MESSRAVGPHGTQVSGPSRFLDVRPQVWSCEQDELPHAANTDTWRWRDNGSAGAPADLRWGGSSVHLIAWDDTQVGNPPVYEAFTEVVYLIGGSSVDVGADECTDVSFTDMPSEVVRMINPDIDTEWSDYNDNAGGGLDDNPPSLVMARALHNTVIALDGSLIVVGGVRAYGSPPCDPWLVPERYETEEIFGPGAEWTYMAEQAQKRSYHSTAFVLPDGTIVSAGGFDRSNLTLNTEHSLEIYSPPYMFGGASRPSIDLGTLHPQNPPLPKSYLDVVDFDVLCSQTRAPLRVALLRPSSVTHATDVGQRYVELALADEPQFVSGRRWHLSVYMPIDAYYAPPGYYMLTVIDDAQIPSVAAWILLE